MRRSDPKKKAILDSVGVEHPLDHALMAGDWERAAAHLGGAPADVVELVVALRELFGEKMAVGGMMATVVAHAVTNALSMLEDERRAGKQPGQATLVPRRRSEHRSTLRVNLFELAGTRPNSRT